MSIPLDRLYQYIENIAEQISQDCVIIYRFFPDGSKNVENLVPLHEQKCSYINRVIFPYLYCHDQEPLDYNSCANNKTVLYEPLQELITKHQIPLETYYFPDRHMNIFDFSLLLHSEKRSINLEKFVADRFIPVYYWSHAVISLDWFRFAEHVCQTKQVKKTFLIYNRAWSGTREYRLKFLEFLLKLGLENQCQTSVNPIEPELGVHYKIHKFDNPIWQPNSILENYFPLNTTPSHYSADFNIEDYQATDIEVVLETLFDDGRLHLTEKSLRPIACAQPFIVAGTYGSLEYLRSYGFKTFGHVWDESYDLVQDPQERLIRITDLMRHIANWAPEIKERKMAQARAIADYNQKYFFSEEFFNLVTSELQSNLKSALNQLEQTNKSEFWFNRRKKMFSYDDIRELFLYTEPDLRYHPIPKREAIMKVVSKARQYYLRNQL